MRREYRKEEILRFFLFYSIDYREGWFVSGFSKKTLGLVLAGSLLFAVSGCQKQAAKDNYPEREVRLVVPYAPGGTVDTAVRQIQPYFSTVLGKPLMIDNRAGAGGQLGVTLVHKEKQEGYVIGSIASPHTEFMLVLENPEFKMEDFAFIGGLTSDPACIRVNSDSPWKTLNEFIADAKSKPPETYTFGVSSIFSDNYLGIKTIEEAAGVKFKIVDFGGGGPSRVALVGKQIDAVHTNVFSSLHIATKSRVLAVQDAKNAYKDITDNAPTVNEALKSNLPNLSTRTFLFTTRQFKEKYPERYKKLVEDFKTAVNGKDYHEMKKKIGEEANISYLSPEESYAMFKQNVETLAKYKGLWKK